MQQVGSPPVQSGEGTGLMQRVGSPRVQLGEGMGLMQRVGTLLGEGMGLMQRAGTLLGEGTGLRLRVQGGSLVLRDMVRLLLVLEDSLGLQGKVKLRLLVVQEDTLVLRTPSLGRRAAGLNCLREAASCRLQANTACARARKEGLCRETRVKKGRNNFPLRVGYELCIFVSVASMPKQKKLNQGILCKPDTCTRVHRKMRSFQCLNRTS